MALMMSVSGVRGLIGETMTPELAASMGAAFGTFLDGGAVVLGMDSRPSGEMVKGAVESGLLAVGCNVVELGIATTPGVALMVSELNAKGGIVITASHNPIVWNGIKFLVAPGRAPSARTAEEIFSIYRSKRTRFADVENIGRMERDLSTNDRHVAKVMRTLDMAAIRRRQLHVVLDSVNGAGGASGRMLLERLDCRVEHMNAEPNGRFAHTPEPTAENLVSLCEAVKASGADIGFAQDPDADRLAIVDNTGRYIGEEYTLALAAKYIFSKTPGAAATNLSTSRMIDDIAAKAGRGCVVHRTAVGEANVVDAITAHRCVIGGEGNGGVIDPRITLVRDSLSSMGMVLSLLAEDWRPLAAIVDEMPSYTMIKQKYDLSPQQTRDWLDHIQRNFADQRISNVDGVRIDWPEGWVHVRPSNTEPIARLIAEAQDETTGKALAKRVADLR
ncbi:MAG: phosphoglucosamine mutase [Planctomycetia bacterium]|nr:phosphoglucosamine mutase [Planctomycetia bacterium]MCC7316511.1 phosphoglucosamine mutase [Planctomycetota bacterium]